ncbi:MAG: nucleotidyl transferase [Blastopirellula sp.]|nr:MAG: nucleotidyl transferase [Blastopirellula sp.]
MENYFLSNDDPSDRITTALLLAAGTGSRLEPLTTTAPKCLTEVNGVPILERQIHSLRECGFKRLVVVVGHLENCIRQYLNEHAGDLEVEYVVSPKYKTTNNIYSLWLARYRIREPFVMLECDLIFDPDLLQDMMVPDRIAVAEIEPWMMGSTVGINSNHQITDFHVGHSEGLLGSRYKTVNIYSFSRSSWQLVAERLNERIMNGKVKDYYETVFAEMVTDGSLDLEPVFFADGCWYEIDTAEDLHEAERIFPGDSSPLTASYG